MFPVLRRSAKVSRGDGRVAIEHLDEEISLEGAGAALLDRMLPFLDGKNNIRARSPPASRRARRACASLAAAARTAPAW